MDSTVEKRPSYLKEMSSEVSNRIRRELSKENLKAMVPKINKETLIIAASAVGIAAVGKVLCDRLLPFLEGGKETSPEVFEIDSTAQTLGECTEVGRAFRNELGDVYMCKAGDKEGVFWILQLPDSGIFIDDEGVSWTRIDKIPGELGEETYHPSWWADDLHFDEELDRKARTMCYSTSEGLGCDIRYYPTPIEP